MGLLRRLIDDESPWSGITTDIEYDADADQIHIARRGDVAPMLEANRRELYSGLDGYTPSRDLQRVASIPNLIVEQWMKAGINIFDEDDWPKIAAMLDSPEYLWLRTAPGRLARKTARTYFTGQGRRRSSAEVLQAVQRGIREGAG